MQCAEAYKNWLKLRLTVPVRSGSNACGSDAAEVRKGEAGWGAEQAGVAGRAQPRGATWEGATRARRRGPARHALP
jgi:hypothetical protein